MNRLSLVGMQKFWREESGQFAIYFGALLVPLGMAMSVALDYSTQIAEQTRLQQRVDAAVLAGAREDKNQTDKAKAYLTAELEGAGYDVTTFEMSFSLQDGVLAGQANSTIPMSFGGAFLKGPMEIGVISKAAIAKTEAQKPCITVLSNTPQAALFNSGAGINASKCEIHVHSQQNPAMIGNAGVTLDVASICLKGTQYINNGGSLKNVDSACAAAPDSHFQKLPEPVVPVSCTSSGAKSGSNHTLSPGRHCGTIFNGSPKFTFEPGLHIITGSMIINAGSEVEADGVTFYFPDTDSGIQFNGGITMKATAPETGPYKGILMFEKTTSATNNAAKRPFVFNGSVSEELSGLIYLPNRDVTYNSTTNHDANEVELVVNTLIVNSANWKMTTKGKETTANAGKPMLIK